MFLFLPLLLLCLCFRIWFSQALPSSPFRSLSFSLFCNINVVQSSPLSLSPSLSRLLDATFPTNLYISHLLLFIFLFSYCCYCLCCFATFAELPTRFSPSSSPPPSSSFLSLSLTLHARPLLLAYFFVILMSMSVEKDLGRSMGRPRARSQTREASTPRARDTPNNTV